MKTQTEIRNADFIRRCIETARREQRRGAEPSARRIVALTVYGPAGGYYISYKRALETVRHYKKIPADERVPIVKESPAQTRARNLTEETEAAMSAYGMTVGQAVTHVLGRGRARRFYISVEYGMRLFLRGTQRTVNYDAAI